MSANRLDGSPKKGDPIEVTHGHSERMVGLSTKWLEEYFSDGLARKPGDMEDDFVGMWSFGLEHWRCTPFFPALAVLVRDGKVVFGQDAEDNLWYAVPGKLPPGVEEEK